MTHILHVDSSARSQGSLSRHATARTVTEIAARNPSATVTYRDLAGGEPIISENWVGANFTPSGERTTLQVRELSHSDVLVSELKAADVIVIGMPIYNFSVPAALKTWVDQVARAGETFRYTSEGPEGLLKGKKAIVHYASGGVPMGAPADFASPYMRHMLGFLGISDVEFSIAQTTADAA